MELGSEKIIQLAPFATQVGYLHDPNGNMNGRKLIICNQTYEALLYDTYIFDAIDIAAKWKSTEVTYERIVHLRYWIRENYNHGHNIPIEGINSMKATKLLIDQLIRLEYEHAEDKEKYIDDELARNKSLLTA